jgi:hypothetical protein
MISKQKVSFFFGAGAEVCYGLPSGGEFALEIFRTIGNEDKKRLREEIARIESTSHQAAWLPDGYAKNSITVFGKANFDNIISSTLEMRRHEVTKAILSFDDAANSAKSQFLSIGVNIDEILTRLGCEPGTQQYSSVISLNERLLQGNVDGLFGSVYFSALVHIIRNGGFTDRFVKESSDLARSFIEILIGALGQDLVHSLNNGIFSRAPDDINFLDDIGGIFNLDYRRVGLDALNYILSQRPFSERRSLICGLNDEGKAIEFYLKIAEIIFSKVADYQSLVDSHYRYLYQPKKEWAKFCKISTFLYAVHRYMTDHMGHSSSGSGYYEDIGSRFDFEVTAIGTSNYTNFITASKCASIFHLNGSLNEYYDPYRNEIIEPGEVHASLQVPFLFTQSGTKPMTSIKMSRRYIDYFDKCKSSERIVVAGYGFNSDDGHINTLIRSLVDGGKNLDVLDYECQDVVSRQKQIADNIRCGSRKNIHVHSVDRNRQINGKPWLEHLFGAGTL